MVDFSMLNWMLIAVLVMRVLASIEELTFHMKED